MINVQCSKTRLSWDCGCAVADSLLRFYKFKIPYKDLVKYSKGAETDGVTPDNMVKLLKRYHIYSTYQRFCSLEQVQKFTNEYNVPVVVPWFTPYIPDNHWCLIHHVGKSQVFYMDPFLVSHKRFPIDSFNRTWFTINPEATKVDTLREMHDQVRWREAIFPLQTVEGEPLSLS